MPFVVAVATSDEGRPHLLLLHVVKRHDGDSIEAMAKAHLAATARVISDGLACFRAVTRAGCAHQPVNVSKASDHGEKLACFRWANTVLGNLKTAIAGTLKSVRPRYAFRYLAEFQYRFTIAASISPACSAVSPASPFAPRRSPPSPSKIAHTAG